MGLGFRARVWIGAQGGLSFGARHAFCHFRVKSITTTTTSFQISRFTTHFSSMASASITVHYSIDPPDGVRMTESLKKDSSIKVDVPSTTAGYYENLRSALADVKAQVGAELTSWRDAVGSLENTKDSKKAPKSDSDEDEGEGEEEE